MSVAAQPGTRTLDAWRPAGRRGLHREAVDALGRRIVSGDIPEGSALPNEADLGEELQVSRTVVREAVKVLAAKGLVITRTRTGTRVQPRTSWDIIDDDVLEWMVAAGPSHDFYADLFEVRSIFEPRAAELAAIRRSPEEAGRLQELLARMEEDGDDREAYISADLRLHAAILTGSHNELLTRLSGTLAVALQAARAVTTRIPAGPSSSMPLHQALIEAIVEQAPEEAREAMQALITYATQDMEAVLAGERGS